MVNLIDRNKSLSTSQLYINNKKPWQIKCSKWLHQCEFVKSSSDYLSSLSSNSVNYSVSEDLEFGFKTTNYDDFVFKSWSSLSKLDESKHLNSGNQSIFDNINIHKSKRIHIGNITYITGPVILNESEFMKTKHKKLNKLIVNKCSSTRYIIEEYGKDNYKISDWKNKSIFKSLSNIIFNFMELCMKLIDGA